MKSEQISEILTMLTLIKPEENPAARAERFKNLYRTMDNKLNFKNLPEVKYGKLFSALSTACGFDDPLDAFEARSHMPEVLSGVMQRSSPGRKLC